MKKIYLVKKDPAAEGQDNWITMNGYEFAMFMKTPEGQARRLEFGRLNACDEKDCIYIIECGHETAKKWDRERKKQEYGQDKDEEEGYIVFSYHQIVFEDEDMTGEDILEDTETNVEEDAIRMMQNQSLHQLVSKLEDDEQAVINALFLSHAPLTEKAFADLHGLDRDVVHTIKRRALRRLKVLCEKYSVFPPHFDTEFSN